MWMISGFGGYILMGTLCTILDLILPKEYKTQQSRRGESGGYFTLTEWFQAVGLSLFNLFITSWLVSLPYSYFKRFYSQYDPMTLNPPNTYSLPTELFKALICVLIVELWFYFSHYLLHQPPFYSAIHKIHHRFKAPIALASMYAHPVEFLVGNLLGVVLGPMITTCHPFTSYVWIHMALMSTGSLTLSLSLFFV